MYYFLQERERERGGQKNTKKLLTHNAIVICKFTYYYNMLLNLGAKFMTKCRAKMGFCPKDVAKCPCSEVI